MKKWSAPFLREQIRRNPPEGPEQLDIVLLARPSKEHGGQQHVFSSMEVHHTGSRTSCADTCFPRKWRDQSANNCNSDLEYIEWSNIISIAGVDRFVVRHNFL